MPAGLRPRRCSPLYRVPAMPSSAGSRVRLGSVLHLSGTDVPRRVPTDVLQRGSGVLRLDGGQRMKTEMMTRCTAILMLGTACSNTDDAAPTTTFGLGSGPGSSAGDSGEDTDTDDGTTGGVDNDMPMFTAGTPTTAPTATSGATTFTTTSPSTTANARARQGTSRRPPVTRPYPVTLRFRSIHWDLHWRSSSSRPHTPNRCRTSA